LRNHDQVEYDNCALAPGVRAIPLMPGKQHAKNQRHPHRNFNCERDISAEWSAGA
jgi:hypothetical protein